VASNQLGIQDFKISGTRGTEGLEGIEVFSTEKPFRVVSCNFVDYRIPRRAAPPCGLEEQRVRGTEGLEVFQRKNHFVKFRVISWIIVFHVEPHRRAAWGIRGVSGYTWRYFNKKERRSKIL
jgi:hypothetical protein